MSILTYPSILKYTAAFALAACFAGPATAQSSRPPMLIHGNYCGPGNNAPAAPIDALDAACARHDACTPDGALAPKSCNLRLQAEASRVSADPRQPEDLRLLAGLVASAAGMMPAAASGTLARAALTPSLEGAVGPGGSTRPVTERLEDPED